jgi:hypothetical protein
MVQLQALLQSFLEYAGLLSFSSVGLLTHLLFWLVACVMIFQIVKSIFY